MKRKSDDFHLEISMGKLRPHAGYVFEKGIPSLNEASLKKGLIVS
jgi:hypothetical protein